MADSRRPRKKKAAPRGADDLRRPRAADDLRQPGGDDEPRRQREADELRRQAEERLDVLAAAAAAAAAAASSSLLVPEELVAAVHELRVHQIELEMQNEELRRAQLELEEQREKYFELFDLAPAGYLTVSNNGIVGDANLTAARLLDVERQLLVGQPFSAFVFTPDRDAYYVHQRRLQKTAEPQTYELRLQRVGGAARGDAETGHFWAHLDSRLERAAGETPSSFVTFTDITARRLAEEEVRRLNAELEERVDSRTAQLAAVTKELEAFAYSASHDLRAPLRAIDGFSAMVMEDAAAALAPEDVRHLERVREAAQRMGRLIDDLLGLSRLARRDLSRERVDVSALAGEIAGELLAENEGRVVEVVIAPGMAADADPRLLRVILRNLLDNAWKFTAKHAAARVEVGIADAGRERAFFVRDDGAGFDPDYAEHLFGAFQRLHSAAEFEGDGIGLAMVLRLVTRHGGKVWAEGRVEQGATFFFTLPRDE